MKKTLALLILLAGTSFMTSCGSNVEIQTQETPATEEEWANTLVHWYPDWHPPVIVHKIEQ